VKSGKLGITKYADGVSTFVSGKRGAWVVTALALALSAGVLAMGGEAASSSDPAGSLPAGAESAKVAALQRQLPSGQQNPALIVYARDSGPLTSADQAFIAADAQQLAKVSPEASVSTPVLAPDGSAALVAVALSAQAPSAETVETVNEIRSIVQSGQRDGLTAQVTGGAGFTADISSSFDGANVSLLLTTVAVVAVLLLVTYRSPWLWLVPLAVVGLADLVTNALLAYLSREAGLPLDPSTIGIVDVLVFGAGTDYALLLIARYREALRHHADPHEAMRRSLRSAGPAIVASGLTVALSLLTLVFAQLEGNRGLGVAGAIGVAVAAAFALTLLPATLSLFGRKLFWPFVPRAGDPDPARTGFWSRIGNGVAARPRLVAVGATILLGVMALGLTDARLGLSRTEQFRVSAESIDALETINRHFPAGSADPVVVIANAGHEEAVRAAITATPGVEAARPGDRTGDLVAFDVILAAEPDSAASYQTISELRTRLHEVPQANALAGGTVAINLDTRTAAIQSLKTVVPLILLVVLVILVVLLRSIFAPVVLVITVVATFFAALGAGNFLFTEVLGYAALDTNVPLLSFLFLVALGVDYNIFLATRAREEAAHHGTRQGMLTALSVTGGVITSAGILLAAVFAVLGVLPLVTLTEIGIIVGIGVLLDTLVVRTLLVPSIAIISGNRFWWPGTVRNGGSGS
jgi:RND superfamily putative drug exporter